MNTIFHSLADIGWGAVIICAFILVAILVEFFDNNKTPKI